MEAAVVVKHLAPLQASPALFPSVHLSGDGGSDRPSTAQSSNHSVPVAISHFILSNLYPGREGPERVTGFP